jgi:serine/threonine-protein kinase
MQLPRSNKAGESPLDPSDADDTPVPTAADSDDDAWQALGSTRVVEGAEASVCAVGGEETPSDASDSDVSDSRIAHAAEPTSLGEFHIVRRIGEGAMGAVYLAKQASFGRDVALKVLFPHIASNPKLVQRLYREGRVMGQLDHPNIVQAYGVGEDQGWHYIALEFIDGVSMQKWLNRVGRLSLGDAVLVTLTVARALGYAHEQSIVHRDVKPDNVLITRRGEIKVADLGMVKIDDEDMALTQTGHAVGTPWYMPLEQAKNAKDTDGRSDIYALGCMLYCMLTGAPPFAGKTLVDVIHAKEIGTFPPARQANPDVPDRLDLVIAKMAAKHPKYRYQTCAELVKDLESLNLANERLEFLQAPIRVEPKPTAPSKSSHPDRPLDYDANIWYVRIKDPEGRVTVHKLPTAQVEKMLEEDRLPPNAKASHHPKDGFRALATYREFQGLALVKASKQAAAQQISRYHNLYRKIEEKDRLRMEQHEQKQVVYKAPDWPALWNTHKQLALKVGLGVVSATVGLSVLWWIVKALWR